MKSTRDLVEQLAKSIEKGHGEYIDLMKEFDSFRGKSLEDPIKLEKVNDLLDKIQKKFKEIYEAFYFIAQMHPMAVKTCNAHDEFIESLKKAGAIQESPKG